MSCIDKNHVYTCIQIHYLSVFTQFAECTSTDCKYNGIKKITESSVYTAIYLEPKFCMEK
jgi:hypothetical protein